MLSAYASVVQTDLNPGERLLWTGQPRRGIVLRPSDAIQIPFSLFWCGFAIFWEVSVVFGGAPIFMAFFGIPFVLIGLYMLVGRFFVDAFRRRSVIYALTDQRIMVYSGVSVRELKSLNLTALPGLQLSERRDGSGTILFMDGLAGRLASWSVSSGSQSLPAFEGIENVRMVFNLAQDAMRRARDERA